MVIADLAQPEAIYHQAPVPAAVVKQVPWSTPAYHRRIALSPFVALAMTGPQGLDCSPRGDAPGFARVANTRTLIMPDRRGNNRIESLRTIVRDPRVALVFLTFGSGTPFRVNGRAGMSAHSTLLASFTVKGQAPRAAHSLWPHPLHAQ